MQNFFYAIISVIIVSVLSLVGIITLILKKKSLESIIMILVSLAAGALLGGAFFHLLPEAVHEGGTVFPYVVLGIVTFFLLESYLYWYHCHGGHIHEHKHKKQCPIKPMGYLNLIGDGIHNFVDGIIIAAAYMVSLELGLIATIAVIFHEIPQEIGDFGVLVYSGFTRYKALLFNFLSALSAIAGVIVTYLFASAENYTIYLIPFAAGGFIYIAMTDLMAELKEEESFKKTTLQIIIFLSGLLLMYSLKFFFEHGH